MTPRRFLIGAAEAFKRLLEPPVSAPPAADPEPEPDPLASKFRKLQAIAASGNRGAVAARRELKTIRTEQLRRGLS